jgi:hypothetical protein
MIDLLIVILRSTEPLLFLANTFYRWLRLEYRGRVCEEFVLGSFW